VGGGYLWVMRKHGDSFLVFFVERVVGCIAEKYSCFVLGWGVLSIRFAANLLIL